MSNSPEHKVAMHQLARERKAAGKPVWASTLEMGDLFNNTTMPFEERRDAIVQRLKSSKWVKGRLEDYGGEFEQLIEEMEDAENEDHFALCIDALYDEADADRVWINSTLPAENIMSDIS